MTGNPDDDSLSRRDIELKKAKLDPDSLMRRIVELEDEMRAVRRRLEALENFLAHVGV